MGNTINAVATIASHFDPRFSELLDRIDLTHGIILFRSYSVPQGIRRMLGVFGPPSILNLRMNRGELFLQSTGHLVRLEGEDNEIIFNSPDCALINTSPTTRVGGNYPGNIQNIGDAAVMRINRVVDIILPQNQRVEDSYEFYDVLLPAEENPGEETRITYRQDAL